jgi:hypothetical protein
VINLITTTLYGLKKAEDGDNADLRIFVSDNMDILEAKLNEIETSGIPVASPTNLGGIIVGTGLTIDPTGLLTTTPYTSPLMDIDTIGGAMVGNGLGMSGDYLFVRTGTGLIIDPAMLNVAVNRTVTDTWYAPSTHNHTEATLTFGGLNAKTYVDNADSYIINTKLDGLSLWSGTQAEYDGLTKDPNTVYYIVG